MDGWMIANRGREGGMILLLLSLSVAIPYHYYYYYYYYYYCHYHHTILACSELSYHI
jgi:hypothetical protein